MDLDNDDFVRFVVAADHNHLEYILIGGMALILKTAVFAIPKTRMYG